VGVDLGRAGTFARLSGASVEGNLHVCSTTGGQVERNIFNPSGNQFEGWTDVEQRIGSDTGNFIDASCAAVLNPANGLEELHVCGVTDDGKLWHSIESPARTFSPFGDVKAQTGDVGRFKRVACTGNAGQLHLVGLTADGKVWHTIRIPTRWAPFANVIDAVRAESAPDTGYENLAIGFCNADVPRDGNRDVSQLNVALTNRVDNSGAIWHTIRATNPVQWAPAPSAPSNWRRIKNLTYSIIYTNPAPQQTDPELWGDLSIGSRPYRP
jgi:hypothetical protein